MRYIISASILILLSVAALFFADQIIAFIPVSAMKAQALSFVCFFAGVLFLIYGVGSITPEPLQLWSLAVKICILGLIVQVLGLPAIIISNIVIRYVAFDKIYSFWPIVGFTGSGFVSYHTFKSIMKEYSLLHKPS